MSEKRAEAQMRNWVLKTIAGIAANLQKMEEAFPSGARSFGNIRFEINCLDEQIRKYNAADDQMRLMLDDDAEKHRELMNNFKAR